MTNHTLSNDTFDMLRPFTPNAQYAVQINFKPEKQVQKRHLRPISLFNFSLQ